jgi:hypothetical protein
MLMDQNLLIFLNIYLNFIFSINIQWALRTCFGLVHSHKPNNWAHIECPAPCGLGRHARVQVMGL